MSQQILAGRRIYFVLATCIVLHELSSIVTALLFNWEKLSLWKSIGLPLFGVYLIASLWQGDKTTRWLVAGCYLMRGGSLLFSTSVIFYHFYKIAADDKPGILLRIIAISLCIPLLQVLLYLVTGFALLFSRKLKAFLAHQEIMDVNPIEDLKVWFTEKFPRNKEPLDPLLERMRKQIRYPALTRDILESLDEYELDQAVVDYVHIQIGYDYQQADAIVAALPPAFQAIYSIYWVDAEVNNGGFHQLFYNKGINVAFMALEGFKFLGATERANLMARAIDIYLQEEPEQLSYRTKDLSQMNEQYVNARNVSSLPELDSLYYQSSMPISTSEYIRTHLDAFVTH